RLRLTAQVQRKVAVPQHAARIMGAHELTQPLSGPHRDLLAQAHRARVRELGQLALAAVPQLRANIPDEAGQRLDTENAAVLRAVHQAADTLHEALSRRQPARQARPGLTLTR